MNRHDVGESPVDVRDEFDFEMDMQAAARSRMPVLISGSPRCALMLAQSIAGRLSRAERNMRILTCDVGDCADLETEFTLASAPTRSPRASILLLREVHALTETGQALLRGLMANRALDAPRVFASSSVPLYKRVADGLFDTELFYYLNAIHIVTSEAPHA